MERKMSDGIATDEEIEEIIRANHERRRRRGQPSQPRETRVPSCMNKWQAEWQRRWRGERQGAPGEPVGLVYFAGAFLGEDLIAVKIGYTERPLESRIASLQTGSPLALRLLAATPGDGDLEGAYHREFSGFRTHGEWFCPRPELLFRIDTIDRANRVMWDLEGRS